MPDEKANKTFSEAANELKLFLPGNLCHSFCRVFFICFFLDIENWDFLVTKKCITFPRHTLGLKTT